MRSCTLVNSPISETAAIFSIHTKEYLMKRMRRLRAHSICLLILSALLVAVPGVVFAQSVSGVMPANAHARSYGGGWDCDRGYREVEGTCAAVMVPANAYPTNMTYGRGWECVHGYRDVRGVCTAVDLPPNAYLDPSGERWKCDRGYRDVDGTCVAIKVPENGYLVDSAYGIGWECERGYRAVDDECMAIKVPENGFFEPSSYGSGWRCERGYHAVDEACMALKLPENAHFDYSGNDWDCNRPYRRQEGECVLR
jgi:hypothetical protein